MLSVKADIRESIGKEVGESVTMQMEGIDSRSGRGASPYPETKIGRRSTNTVVGFSRCRVRYSDGDGVAYALEVENESLYEAVALAVAQSSEDEMSPRDPAPVQEFTVTVLREPVKHKIRFKQMQNWAKPTVIGGLA